MKKGASINPTRAAEDRYDEAQAAYSLEPTWENHVRLDRARRAVQVAREQERQARPLPVFGGSFEWKG